MSSLRRWGVVAAGVLVLVCLPSVVSRLPTSGSSLPAAQLLARIQASANIGYSGYAESSGNLSLPVTTSQISHVSDLLSSRTQLRIWWRSAADWRVDAINLTGEHDTHQGPLGTWTWDYEANTATLILKAPNEPIRLPESADLVPASLARRLLSQAASDEVRRLPGARIAGHDATGLRLTPGDTQSSIDHVDVWALPASGLPVSVSVYAKGVSGSVFDTSLQDVATTMPDASVTAFEPPPGARIREQRAPDIVALMDQIADIQPPRELAGLPVDAAIRHEGSVGVYGHGLTVLVAIPLPARVAGPLDEQLEKLVGATRNKQGVTVTVPPVALLLSNQDVEGQAWLLAGTVTSATLTTAAAELPPISEVSR
jgi:hypothetical protein